MRKVMPKEMVCHVWANRSQDHARTSNGNLYFTGPTLYSYGTHFVIATFLADGAILWNNSTYGPTTTAHQYRAWHALAGWQRNNVYRVPGLDDNDARAIARGKPDEVVKRCIAKIGSILQDATKRRKFELVLAALTEARIYETAARKLCADAKRKYPIALLPDTLADKQALAELVGELNEKELLAEYKVYLAHANDSLQHFVDHPGSAQNSLTHLVDARGYTLRASNSYKLAHGKASSACGKLSKKIDALMPAAKAAVEAEAIQNAHGELAYSIRELYAAQHRMRLQARRVQSTSGSRILRMLQRAESAVEMIGNAGPWAKDMERFQRVMSYRNALSDLEHDRAQLEVMRDSSCGIGARLDAARHILRDHYVNTHPAFRAKYIGEIRVMRASAQPYADQAEALIAQENAQRIAAWIAGESNVRPDREAGTFARIKGNTVETTQGASVPLQDAVELVRLARVTMRRGGASWPQGEGPRVGHFRVDSIAANGATVIGCHEFSAAEANRIMAVIEACEVAA